MQLRTPQEVLGAHDVARLTDAIRSATRSSAVSTATSTAPRLHGWLSSLVSRPLFWAIFVLLGLAIPIGRTMAVKLPPPLPVLAHVPAFTFTDQYGKPFSSQQLEGKVWIAN